MSKAEFALEQAVAYMGTSSRTDTRTVEVAKTFLKFLKANPDPDEGWVSLERPLAAQVRDIVVAMRERERFDAEQQARDAD